MTLNELNKITPDTNKIYFIDGWGCVQEFNRLDPVTLAAYGDFIIGSIEARNKNEIEIRFILVPQKKEG